MNGSKAKAIRKIAKDQLKKATEKNDKVDFNTTAYRPGQYGNTELAFCFRGLYKGLKKKYLQLKDLGMHTTHNRKMYPTKKAQAKMAEIEQLRITKRYENKTGK